MSEDELQQIAQNFQEAFANWGIELPRENLSARRRGEITQAGWHIRFLFGSDEKGEYLDYYSSHRMTNNDHMRLYESGEVEDLPALSDGFFSPSDPEEHVRLQAEFELEEQRTAELLKAKGFLL